MCKHGRPCSKEMEQINHSPFIFEKISLTSFRALFFLLLFSLHVWLFVTPCTAARQASLSFTISRSLLKLMFIESVMPSRLPWSSNYFVLCCQLFLLPSIFPSIRVFSNELALRISCEVINWSIGEVLELQHQSFQWIFRTDFLEDWLVGSLCCSGDSQESSTPQFESINSTLLTFFMVQFSHLNMTTGKTIALSNSSTKVYTDFCWQSDVSFFFIMLSRLVMVLKGASIF